MTQQTAIKEYNTFVKGIITEAGPLTFPENASLDEENTVLNRDGSRQRRLGMDFEEDFVLRSATILSDDAVGSYRWHNAANNPLHQLAVVQAGQTVFVFDAKQTSISANLIATLDLSAYITGKTLLQVASGMGYLFITEGSSKPIYLSYDPVLGTCAVSVVDIKIRDFFGVEDGVVIPTHPSASAEHTYNLQNQGWNTAQITAYAALGGGQPGNEQVWFIGKDSDDNFSAALLNKQQFGTTPAPKGRYVIDAFARSTSRDAVSGLTTPADIETAYPSVVAFAFERAFYAGVASTVIGAAETRPNMTGFVFFTRTLRSAKDFGQCHSDADPTSEIDSELVDTDGGYLNIPDSGKIHKLMSKGASVLVLADQGVWAITGDAGGFRATSYQVTKISDFGVLSGTSVVDMEDEAAYWSRAGIYHITPDPQSGRLVSTNISEATIQTYYNELNLTAKLNATGSYDPVNRRVSWLYNDDLDYDGISYVCKFNRELVIDMVLKAFNKNSISSLASPSPYIAGYLETPDFLLRQEGVRSRGDSVTKYLTVQFIDEATNAASVSFAYYRNAQFRDWYSLNDEGESFLSYLITGYELAGDSIRPKQAAYLVAHFKQTELNAVAVGDDVDFDNPSGCLMQAQWDWSNDPDSGKWGQQFQAYRLLRPYMMTAGQPVNYGHDVVSTRNRLPGRGRALSLYITSDGDKDFYLYGWAIKLTGNANV